VIISWDELLETIPDYMVRTDNLSEDLSEQREVITNNGKFHGRLPDEEIYVNELRISFQPRDERVFNSRVTIYDEQNSLYRQPGNNSAGKQRN
jgi:hypothetical protein